jgi:hypothetical protein
MPTQMAAKKVVFNTCTKQVSYNIPSTSRWRLAMLESNQVKHDILVGQNSVRAKSKSTWIALIASMMIIGCVLYQSPNFGGHNETIESPIAGDFLQEWIGGYSLRTSGPASLFDNAHLKALQHDEALVGFSWNESSYFAMVYPPFYYLLWVPFSLLPYPVAAWVFIAVMIGCFFASHFILSRAVIAPTVELPRVEAAATDPKIVKKIKPALPWFLVGAAIYVPVVRCVTTGQKGTVCLLILAASYYLYSRNKKFASGLAFGLMAFKPQLAIVIGFTMLLRKQWSFVWGSLAAVAVFVGMCLLMGTDVCWQYTQFCLGAGDYLETSGYDLYKSHCLYGFFTLLSGGETTGVTRVLWMISAAAVVGLLVRMFRIQKDQPREIREPIEFSALVLASLLLTPHLFSYDLAMLLMPMYLLFGVVQRGGFAAQQKYA